jgi:hypothetical protein
MQHIKLVHVYKGCADAQPATEQVKEKRYNWILQNKRLIHTFSHTNEKNRYTKHKFKYYISPTQQSHADWAALHNTPLRSELHKNFLLEAEIFETQEK